MSLWHASVLTLYPAAFPGLLDLSIAGRARASEIWTLDAIDIRAFSGNRRGSVDDTPAGGGAGMVLRADVAARAVSAARGLDGCKPRPLVYPSPRGAILTQKRVREWAAGPGLIVFCGRFEGLDERAIDHCAMEEVSLGDFVLAGGEIAAMAMIEATIRLLPGVAGNAASLSEESFEAGLLEYPHYTRPRVWEGREIPEPLLSGDHARIAKWRRAEAERITRARRPDLWAAQHAPENVTGSAGGNHSRALSIGSRATGKTGGTATRKRPGGKTAPPGPEVETDRHLPDAPAAQEAGRSGDHEPD